MPSRYATATRQLLDALPDEADNTAEALQSAAFDSLKIAFPPEAVVRPTRAETVAKVLKLANEHRVPVTPRGSGTTLTGSATPILGGWVLDMSALNHIRIDPLQRTAIVGCGAITRHIQDAAAAQNLFYPPDPSSHQHCTIGGNLACNAGGLRCVKYGVTRDYVLALKGYLPSGESVEWGRAVRKFATGFNIRDLWIGSEGMLGVITEATLKLIPLPQERRALLAAFESDTAALNATLELQQSGMTPSILEFIDTLSVKGAETSENMRFFPELGTDYAVVLLEVDGSIHSIESDWEVACQWAKRNSHHLRFALNANDAEKLWIVRRKCSGAMFRLGNSKLNEDIVVPLATMPELMTRIHAMRHKHGVPIAVFGHAGDGNLHVNLMYDRENAAQSTNAQICLMELMQSVVALGGAISGEHGIGLAKSHFLSLQFNPAELQLMKGLKTLFDPNHILNPGKWFKPFSPWDYPRVEHRFPWDHR
jgi:glycolate oxidase